MPKRGLSPAAGTPDLTISTPALTLGASTQTLGQFLPSVAQWGVPFAVVTTSFEAIHRFAGADLNANGKPVWRGIAEAQIKMDLDENKRE
jgi:hypothetical protein